ncbi:hypothetical protein EI94DRAFT_1704038 [Lactarius quietus]|nr:hypothetical protein EI94DRAFT_1704038 [Lactarius quietus]
MANIKLGMTLAIYMNGPMGKGGQIYPALGRKQRKCLHEHWKNCHDYPEAHTWEAHDQKDIEEEEAVRALVAAEDDSYLAYDEVYKVRQLDGRTVPGRRDKNAKVAIGIGGRQLCPEDDQRRQVVIVWCKTSGLMLDGSSGPWLDVGHYSNGPGLIPFQCRLLAHLLMLTIVITDVIGHSLIDVVRRCHLVTNLKLGSLRGTYWLFAPLQVDQVVPEFRSHCRTRLVEYVAGWHRTARPFPTTTSTTTMATVMTIKTATTTEEDGVTTAAMTTRTTGPGWGSGEGDSDGDSASLWTVLDFITVA